MLFAPTIPFRSILDLRFLDRLPLHVARDVRAPTLQRNNVIHDVAFPAFRITGWIRRELFLPSCSPGDTLRPSVKLANNH
jgi:hypothetical protein